MCPVPFFTNDFTQKTTYMIDRSFFPPSDKKCHQTAGKNHGESGESICRISHFPGPGKRRIGAENIG